jgi:hypothetical protein
MCEHSRGEVGARVRRQRSMCEAGRQRGYSCKSAEGSSLLMSMASPKSKCRSLEQQSM